MGTKASIDKVRQAHPQTKNFKGTQNSLHFIQIKKQTNKQTNKNIWAGEKIWCVSNTLEINQ